MNTLPMMGLCVGIVGLLVAQPVSPPTVNHDFDFWIGEWEVSTADGKVVGHNRIASLLGGRVVQENYTTAGEFAGHSYNAYNAPAARWEQFWVDNQGTVLHLKGGLNDVAQMVMSGERTVPGGKIVVDRITWTPHEDGSVQQHWEMSRDAGRTWTTVFDGTYRRVTLATNP